MDAKHKFVTIPFGLIVPVVILIGSLFMTHNTAAGNKEDIQSLAQAQKADHDIITRQSEKIENINEKVEEFDDELESISHRQMEQTAILYQLRNQLGNQ